MGSYFHNPPQSENTALKSTAKTIQHVEKRNWILNLICWRPTHTVMRSGSEYPTTFHDSTQQLLLQGVSFFLLQWHFFRCRFFFPAECHLKEIYRPETAASQRNPERRFEWNREGIHHFMVYTVVVHSCRLEFISALGPFLSKLHVFMSSRITTQSWLPNVETPKKRWKIFFTTLGLWIFQTFIALGWDFQKKQPTTKSLATNLITHPLEN